MKNQFRQKDKDMINKLYYMTCGRNNTVIGCAPNASYFEQFGISNIEVLKRCLGFTRVPIFTDEGVQVRFYVREL